MLSTVVVSKLTATRYTLLQPLGLLDNWLQEG